MVNKKFRNRMIGLALMVPGTFSFLGSTHEYLQKQENTSTPLPSYENSFNIEQEMAEMRAMRLEERRAANEERRLYESKIEELSQIEYRTENFRQDEDYVLLGRMLLGECEGCNDYEKIAVAWTAINRANDGVEWNGETLSDAILAPMQYSAFNSDRNPKLRNPMRYNPREFLEGLILSQEILDGKHPDPTNGATHYFNRNHSDLDGEAPYWADSFEKVVLEGVIHEFFKPKQS